jgi:hypothetical protein
MHTVQGEFTIFVAHELFHCADDPAAFQRVGGEGMAEGAALGGPEDSRGGDVVAARAWGYLRPKPREWCTVIGKR